MSPLTLHPRLAFAALPAFLLASALGAKTAHAHIELSDPLMRGGDQKTGPCEGSPRGAPKEYEAGATITVSWNETVDHPGSFRISFDPDGDDFDGDGDGTADFPPSQSGDGGNGSDDLVLLDVPDDGAMDHSAEVTLPAMACDNCTLQVLQNMGDRMPSAMNPTAHIYFRCADLVLVGDGGGGGGAGGETMMPVAGSGGMLVAVGGGGATAAGGMAPDLVPAGGMPNVPVMMPTVGDPIPTPTMEGTGGSSPVDVPVPNPTPMTPGATPPAMSSGGAPVQAPQMTAVPANAPVPAPVPVPAPAGTAAGAPSASASATGTSLPPPEDGGSDEGGCFARISPTGPSPASAWLLLALLPLLRRRPRR